MDPGERGSFRLAERCPWLAPAREQIAQSLRTGRLAHALLLQGQVGLGKAALADWIARLALCEAPGNSACGVCTACQLYDAATHPDVVRVGLVDEKKQIAVDDVREMTSGLALKSYRGVRKVAIVHPADAMNPNGANALLKTLEEPAGPALLILTVARPERLPATIASRCQRIQIARPERGAALAWLEAEAPGTDWAGPLALASGAPLEAIRLAASGAHELDAEMTELPSALIRPDADLVGMAERCKQRLPAERLRWIENWVTERIRRGLAPGGTGHTPGTPGLPSAARTRHIQGLYMVLDEVRLAQAALRGSASVEMLFERLLTMLSRELVTVRAAAPPRLKK